MQTDLCKMTQCRLLHKGGLTRHVRLQLNHGQLSQGRPGVAGLAQAYLRKTPLFLVMRWSQGLRRGLEKATLKYLSGGVRWRTQG